MIQDLDFCKKEFLLQELKERGSNKEHNLKKREKSTNLISKRFQMIIIFILMLKKKILNLKIKEH